MNFRSNVCVCCPLVFEFSVGIGVFVIGLGQISFFFSLLGVKFDGGIPPLDVQFYTLLLHLFETELKCF